MTRKKTTLPAASRAPPVSPLGHLFAGFDDYMEQREPGYKAKMRAENAERHRQAELYRDTVIAKYGSAEAALAPCKAEQALVAATKHLARREMKEYGNGDFETDTLDGWSDEFSNPPETVIAAVSGAYPLPDTVAAARAEVEHWDLREREITAAGRYTHDNILSLPCTARRRIVRKLHEEGLSIRDLDDLYERLRLAAERGEIGDAADIVKAALPAFERLVMGILSPVPPADREIQP